MEYIEIEVAGETFRIRKERSLLAEGQVEKISARDGAIGAHEIIMIDCKIFDRKTKKFRNVLPLDLDKIPRKEGFKLTDKIMEIRQEELGFTKTQKESEKKPKNLSGGQEKH